jgi:hypothetical protein
METGCTTPAAAERNLKPGSMVAAPVVSTSGFAAYTRVLGVPGVLTVVGFGRTPCATSRFRNRGSSRPSRRLPNRASSSPSHRRASGHQAQPADGYGRRAGAQEQLFLRCVHPRDNHAVPSARNRCRRLGTGAESSMTCDSFEPVRSHSNGAAPPDACAGMGWCCCSPSWSGKVSRRPAALCLLHSVHWTFDLDQDPYSDPHSPRSPRTHRDTRRRCIADRQYPDCVSWFVSLPEL